MNLNPNETRYLFLDLETTGLSPFKNEVIEIGLVFTGEDTTNIIDKDSIQIWPEKIDIMDEVALELNGFRERIKEWELNGVSKKQAVQRLQAYWLKWLKDYEYHIVCHDSTFDIGFLQALFNKCGEDIRYFKSRRTLDTVSIAKGLGFEHYKGDYILEYFGKEPEDEVHIAMDGALKTQKIYNLLLQF